MSMAQKSHRPVPARAHPRARRSATLGADWYDEMRDVAKVRGRFSAIAADLPDIARTNSLARWAVTPLFAAEPDFATTLVKASGGLQMIIANADRPVSYTHLRAH